MQVSKRQLRQIIVEEVSKEIREVFGDLSKPIPPEDLERAGLTFKGKTRPKQPKPPVSPIIPWDKVSDEAKQIAAQLERELRIPEEQTTSIVQKVLDLLRKKGISFGE